MTRVEQLKFCKICKNQKFDFKEGIICGLTNLPADFETSCDSFNEDMELKDQNELRSKKNEILNKTASKGKRFSNYLLDLIFYFIFSFILGAFLGIILFFVSPESLSIFDGDNKLVDYVLGFIAGMIYYTTFEALTGRTLAKYITKTKVVSESGENPDLSAILIRSLCRFIPFEPFSFLGSKKSGWHDRLSKTIVIEI
jgi:uncharacterized RDD family membrane protein YckC